MRIFTILATSIGLFCISNAQSLNFSIIEDIHNNKINEVEENIHKIIKWGTKEEVVEAYLLNCYVCYCNDNEIGILNNLNEMSWYLHGLRNKKSNETSDESD